MGSTVSPLYSIPPGEFPPPPPRACFGRDKVTEKIVGLAEHLTPIALIGPGGIGKTSIALTVLHHDRIKEQFGDNRRFIRCDEFPASRIQFLSRLSKAIGAGVENPEDLTPLRPFLSSRKMILVLDNTESILDPQGTDTRDIYAVVEELSQLGNICLFITSRISIIPPAFESFEVPTLSVEAARRAFFRIYKYGGQSDLVDGILDQLDFHPLSITLLASIAHHNKWDIDQLNREWERQRMGVLHTQHDTSLATTIELSLSSPMFRELGPDARELLGVIAFFPQGVSEKNFDRSFPTLSNRTNIFNDFCILSLAYRNNGFITMLAPLRDYLRLKDPTSSPLLCATKDHYFRRLSVGINPGEPGFEEARWITFEDVNVEHLLDVFTSTDVSSADIWDACSNFMKHLYWHKPRLITLGPKVEGLSDDHPSKPQCLRRLAWLFSSVGNNTEFRRLLIYDLELWRQRGDDFEVAQTLRFISEANRALGLREEGVQQAREALAVSERLNDRTGQAQSWKRLARLLSHDKQFDAAEDAVLKSIEFLSYEDDKFEVCGCFRILGKICGSRGETEKATYHYNAALEIASFSNWHDQLFLIHHSLAQLFFSETRFDDVHAHVEHAKPHAANDSYRLGRVMELQARCWYKQRKFKDAKSEALHAIDAFEKVRAVKHVEDCRALLRKIEQAASRRMDLNGELRERHHFLHALTPRSRFKVLDPASQVHPDA